MTATTLTSVDGVALRYVVHGRPSGDAVPLVLVHGYTGSSLDWIDVVDELAHDRCVVTFDHRGHGESGHAAPGTYRLESLVSDLGTVVDGVGLDRFHLLGHSMGGMVSMRFALDERRAGQLASLVLMDTAASAVGGIKAMFGAAFDVARTSGMTAVMALVEPYVPPGSALERMRIKYAQLDPTAFIELADDMASAAPVIERLGDLRVATTVLVGELDAPFRQPSEAMAAAIPGSVLVVIAGAGHSPQDDRPAEWLAAVRTHLAAVS